MVLERAAGKGISLARLRGRVVTIHSRRGGERIQPDPGRPRKALKNLLQEASVPPWVRERMPLLFCGRDLVWVPGIGTACDYKAAVGEASIEPRWNPG